MTAQEESIWAGLQEAIEKLEKLEQGAGEIVLDFAPGARVNAQEVEALRRLAEVAEAKSARVVLRGVSVTVYKVLKLLNLTERFVFENSGDSR